MSFINNLTIRFVCQRIDSEGKMAVDVVIVNEHGNEVMIVASDARLGCLDEISVSGLSVSVPDE